MKKLLPYIVIVALLLGLAVFLRCVDDPTISTVETIVKDSKKEDVPVPMPGLDDHVRVIFSPENWSDRKVIEINYLKGERELIFASGTALHSENGVWGRRIKSDRLLEDLIFEPATLEILLNFPEEQ